MEDKGKSAVWCDAFPTNTKIVKVKPRSLMLQDGRWWQQKYGHMVCFAWYPCCPCELSWFAKWGAWSQSEILTTWLFECICQAFLFCNSPIKGDQKYWISLVGLLSYTENYVYTLYIPSRTKNKLEMTRAKHSGSENFTYQRVNKPVASLQTTPYLQISLN